MKSLQKGLGGILLALFLLVPHPVRAEQIDTFYADITIGPDGVLHVVEAIDYDFGFTDRHGIFRTIPFIKTNEDGKRFQMEITPGPVTGQNGEEYISSITTSGDNKEIKIGDPNTTITGKHMYVIPYTVKGGITYFSDHDEVYWNVTGNDWQVPIQDIRATVFLPKAIDAAALRSVCYTGFSGSTAQDCTVQYEVRHDKAGLSPDVGVATFTTSSLAAHEGLTIVVGFPKNLVATVEPHPVINFFDTGMGKLVILGVIILAIGWYMVLPISIIVLWWKKGRDPKASLGVASAWFSPPQGEGRRDLTPGEVGTLLDERADFQDITATIVDLARRGYLHILEKKVKGLSSLVGKKEEFQLKKMKEFQNDSELLPFEKALLSGIFIAGDVYEVKGTGLVSTVEKTKQELYAQVVTEGFFDRNPQTTRNLYIALGVIAVFTGNLPLALASFIFGYLMPRKTIKGVEAANIGRSLKNFLTSQERFLKFQAEKQLMFEKLLPYAIAFGVERIWAERFKDMKLTPPEWYEGYHGRSFTSTHFVHHLDTSFSTRVSSAATPTRSSSGFSSGFSSGSSGGGGGGGGGGSW